MIDKIIPPAFKLWLVFLFTFLLLGYDVVPSILLGVVAGFAGGTVIAWWHTPGGEPTTTLELPASLKQFDPTQLPLGRFFRRGSNRQRTPRTRRQ
jgi:hypothetical protein